MRARKITLSLTIVFWLGGSGLLAQNKILVFPRVAQAQGTPIPRRPSLGQYPNIAYYDPVYQNLAEFQMGIALTNVSKTASGHVALTAYGEDGKPLAGSNITNPAFADLSPGNQKAKYAFEYFGQGIMQKIAWVEASYTTGDIRGFYLVYDNAFNFLSGAEAIPLEKADTKVVLPIADAYRDDMLGSEYRTEIDIVNPNNASVKITLEYYFQRNTDKQYYKKTWEKIISPKGKIQADWFDFDNYEQGEKHDSVNSYFKLYSDLPIIASGTTLFNSSPTKFAIVDKTYSLAVVPGVSIEESLRMAGKDWNSGLPVVRPHVAIAPGWRTKLISITGSGNFLILDENGQILNQDQCAEGSTCWQRISVDYLGKKEADIASFFKSPITNFGGSLTYEPIGIPDTPAEKGLMYYEEFTSDKVEFFSDEQGVIRANAFRVLVPPISKTFEAVLGHVAEGEFAPGQSFGTGLAVRDSRMSNTDQDKDVNKILLELYASDGKLVDSKTWELGPAAKFAKTAQELFPKMSIPQFSGYIKITGTRPFVSLGMYWVNKHGRIVSTSMIPQQTFARSVDNTPPAIKLTSPSCAIDSLGWFDCGSTNKNPFSFSGIASDSSGIATITWMIIVGTQVVQSGTATGTNNWTVTGIVWPHVGQNVVIVSAYDAAGNQTQLALRVMFTPP